MKRMRRLFCLLLSLVFIAALIPVTAAAALPDDMCYGDDSPDGNHDWYLYGYRQEPSCTEGGTAHYVCRYCDRDYFEPVPAKGHNFNREDYAVGSLPPTCTAGSTRVRICGICGAQESF